MSQSISPGANGKLLTNNAEQICNQPLLWLKPFTIQLFDKNLTIQLFEKNGKAGFSPGCSNRPIRISQSICSTART